MKAYGFIHTHSEYSLKDAPLKLADIVKEAKKMGATAIALTDHGTAAGWIEFYDLCKNEGIKPILGVEAYIRSETNSRTHLILLAKNYTGYKEISQAISDSNENIERIADMDIPIMTKEILQKYLHLAAMSESCKLKVETVHGLKNKIFGGEGFFNTIVTGPGHVWIQTMPANKMAGALHPYMSSGD